MRQLPRVHDAHTDDRFHTHPYRWPLSIRVAEQLQEIGKKHRLHIDKIDALFDEAGAVMLGLTHPRDFIGKLAQKLDIDKEKTKKIAQDVNEQIFKPIRESLKKIHGIAEEQPPIIKPKISRREAPETLDREKILKEIEKD